MNLNFHAEITFLTEDQKPIRTETKFFEIDINKLISTMSDSPYSDCKCVIDITRLIREKLWETTDEIFVINKIKQINKIKK